MNTSNDTFSVTDLRHKTTMVLNTTAQNGIVYLVRHSKPAAAMVSVDYLRSLQEAYEDYLDILEFDQTARLKRVALETHKKNFARRK